MSDDLLIELFLLAQRINSHGGVLEGDSMVERYKYFKEHSIHGKDCAYARKCRDLFLQYDYSQIRDRIIHIMKLLDDIEPVMGGKHVKWRSVDPVTREPTGPLRNSPEDAQDDDNEEFIKKEKKK